MLHPRTAGLILTLCVASCTSPPQPADLLTVAELEAGAADYTVNRRTNNSFGTARIRLALTVTTSEREPERIVEALMRAAVEPDPLSRNPDAVIVFHWMEWPPPPDPPTDEFLSWPSWQQSLHMRKTMALRSITYAPDGCGWTGTDCGPWLWEDVSPQEMPRWLVRTCPDVMREPCPLLRQQW